MAARLFKRSALSTKPNFGGGVSGEEGGCVTPCKCKSLGLRVKFGLGLKKSAETS